MVATTLLNGYYFNFYSYYIVSKFTLVPFHADFPFPETTENYLFKDYIRGDYLRAELEINTFEVKFNNLWCMQLRSGLLIQAGDSDLPDSYLVLTTKALAALLVGV